MDVNDIFSGSLDDETIVEDKHMEKFVDAIRDEITDALVAKDMLDTPITVYIVTMCADCEKFHLVGSKMGVEKDGDMVFLDGLPPVEIMEEYCRGIGATVVKLGLIPVAAGLVVPAFFYAGEVPPDYQDEKEAAKDVLFMDVLAKTGTESIRNFRDGGKPDNTGEATFVQALSIDGHLSAGFVITERDSLGFARPANDLSGVEFAGQSGKVCSSDALQSLVALFSGSKDALARAMSGKDIDVDDRVSFLTKNDTDPII
jgi:hypothetical protein